MSSTYQDLRVWQRAMKLAELVYHSTGSFPKAEIYGLTSQMRRAAVSIPSNIAEGKGHRSDKDFVRFLFHARGSVLELETQVLLAGRLQYLTEALTSELTATTREVGRELNSLIRALSTTDRLPTAD
jgi:four helix bundle protein